MSHVCFNTCVASPCNVSISRQAENTFLNVHVFGHCLDTFRNGVSESPKYSVLSRKEQIRAVSWICSQWKHTVWMPSCKDRKPDSFLLSRVMEEIHVAVRVWIATIHISQPSHALTDGEKKHFMHAVAPSCCSVDEPLNFLHASILSCREKTLPLQPPNWTRWGKILPVK